MKQKLFIGIMLLGFLTPTLTFAASPAPTTTNPDAAKEYQDTFFPECNKSGQPALQCWTDAAYKWSLAAIGFLAFFMLVVSGILYMASGGNPEMMGKAKKYMTGTFLGVGLLIIAELIITFVKRIFNF